MKQTAKQKAIREAYGEHWEKWKNYIDDEGWFNNGSDDFYLRYKDTKGTPLEKCDYLNDILLRPKSLSGIETNNGWIKIESASDLPKQDNNLWLRANDGSIIQGRYCIFQKTFNTTYGNNFDSDGVFFTHYQAIDKPKPPIY